MNKYPVEEGSEDGISIEGEMEMNEELHPPFYQDEIRNAELHKLNHRVTMLSILIPCLIGAVLLIAYLDLRFRMSQTQTTRSKKVETLSEDIVQKIESLSYQYETLDASLTSGLSALEQSAASIKERLARDEKTIEGLTASKTDKKTFAALQKNVTGQQESLGKLAKELRGKLTEDGNILMVLQNDLMGQKKEIADAVELMEEIREKDKEQESSTRHVLDGKVDKETLHHSLKEVRASYEEERILLEEKLKSAEKALLRLEREVNMIKKSIEEPGTEDFLRKGELSEGSTSSTPAPVSDTILEQEIKE